MTGQGGRCSDTSRFWPRLGIWCQPRPAGPRDAARPQGRPSTGRAADRAPARDPAGRRPRTASGPGPDAVRTLRASPVGSDVRGLWRYGSVDTGARRGGKSPTLDMLNQGRRCSPCQYLAAVSPTVGSLPIDEGVHREPVVAVRVHPVLKIMPRARRLSPLRSSPSPTGIPLRSTRTVTGTPTGRPQAREGCRFGAHRPHADQRSPAGPWPGCVRPTGPARTPRRSPHSRRPRLRAATAVRRCRGVKVLPQTKRAPSGKKRISRGVQQSVRAVPTTTPQRTQARLGPSHPSEPQQPLSMPVDRTPRASSGWITRQFSGDSSVR